MYIHVCVHDSLPLVFSYCAPDTGISGIGFVETHHVRQKLLLNIRVYCSLCYNIQALFVVLITNLVVRAKHNVEVELFALHIHKRV